MAGLCAVLWNLHHQKAQDGLSTRFRATLMLAAIFFGARALHWLGLDGVVRWMAYASAALLPLTVLLLAEGLVRRHAPLWIKIVTSVGTVVLPLWAMNPAATGQMPFLLGLLLHQLLVFSLAGWLIWRRDPDSLSGVENTRIRQLSIALALLLPFLLTDYRLDAAPIPVRLSGLAVLVMCWLSLSMQFAPTLRGSTGIALAWSVLVPVVAAVALTLHLDLSFAVGIQVWAMIQALLIVFELGRMVVRVRLHARSGALLGDLARKAHLSLDDFIKMLRHRAGAEGALIVTQTELRDFDANALRAGFDGAGLCALTSLPRDPVQDTLSQSQMRLLLARYGAAQAALVSASPFAVALLRSGTFGGATPSAELGAAFAMARLISERDADRSTT